jgi:hypothetical protein
MKLKGLWALKFVTSVVLAHLLGFELLAFAKPTPAPRVSVQEHPQIIQFTTPPQSVQLADTSSRVFTADVFSVFALGAEQIAMLEEQVAQELAEARAEHPEAETQVILVDQDSQVGKGTPRALKAIAKNILDGGASKARHSTSYFRNMGAQLRQRLLPWYHREKDRISATVFRFHISKGATIIGLVIIKANAATQPALAAHINPATMLGLGAIAGAGSAFLMWNNDAKLTFIRNVGGIDRLLNRKNWKPLTWLLNSVENYGRVSVVETSFLALVLGGASLLGISPHENLGQALDALTHSVLWTVLGQGSYELANGFRRDVQLEADPSREEQIRRQTIRTTIFGSFVAVGAGILRLMEFPFANEMLLSLATLGAANYVRVLHSIRHQDPRFYRLKEQLESAPCQSPLEPDDLPTQ